MQISPQLALVIKIALTLANAIGNGTLVLTGVFDVPTATKIALCCQVFVSAVGIVTSAYSSSAPGPLAPADAPVVVAATAVANLPKTASAATITEVKNEARAAVSAHNP